MIKLVLISLVIVVSTTTTTTLKSLILQNSSSRPFSLELDLVEANSWLISTNIIINSMKSVKDIFKYSHNTTLVNTMQQEGFKTIYMKSLSQLRQGLKSKYYFHFVQWLLKEIELPEDYQQQFLMILANPTSQDESMITKYSTIYNKNSTDPSKGTMTYMQLKVKAYVDKDTYDIMWAKFDSDFNLAPSIKVIQETTSKFNGANVHTVQRLQDYDRGVNDADLQMVIAYFESIAYCKFANDELGLDIDIPDSL